MAFKPSVRIAAPPHPVTVRAAEPSDAAALVALARGVAREPEGWLLVDDGWRSVADERRYLRAVRRSRSAAVIVAVDPAGTPIGRLSIARDPHPSSPHVADVGLIVAIDHRRRGVGSALLRAAESWACTQGVAKIELHVFPHNTAAIGLYERAGYEREGLRRAHYRRPDGRLVDAILMAKLL